MTIDLKAADELLSTTRAVRKRLDLTRPVPREVILDCVRLAQRGAAPSTPSAGAGWWSPTRPSGKAIADAYRGSVGDFFVTAGQAAEQAGQGQTARVYDSAQYLTDHLHEVPVHVIPCLLGRPPENGAQAGGFFASIYPAVWSFNLALRARGLGTVLTTIHMRREKEIAELLGIPGDVAQAALLPVAYTLGLDFKPADRPAPETITYWDRWEG